MTADCFLLVFQSIYPNSPPVNSPSTGGQQMIQLIQSCSHPWLTAVPSCFSCVDVQQQPCWTEPNTSSLIENDSKSFVRVCFVLFHLIMWDSDSPSKGPIDGIWKSHTEHSNLFTWGLRDNKDEDRQLLLVNRTHPGIFSLFTCIFKTSSSPLQCPVENIWQLEAWKHFHEVFAHNPPNPLMMERAVNDMCITFTIHLKKRPTNQDGALILYNSQPRLWLLSLTCVCHWTMKCIKNQWPVKGGNVVLLSSPIGDGMHILYRTFHQSAKIHICVMANGSFQMSSYWITCQASDRGTVNATLLEWREIFVFLYWILKSEHHGTCGKCELAQILKGACLSLLAS